MKDCPIGKIYNPHTKRCILMNGSTAKKLEKLKMIINKKNENTKESMVIKECPKNKIYNPKTKRCVLQNGVIGKQLLTEKIIKNAKRNSGHDYLKWENNSCYMDSLFIALFYRRSKFIEEILLKAKVNDYGNYELKKIGENIKLQLISIYEKISGIDKNDVKSCSILRVLLDRYYSILKRVNPKIKIISLYDNWTTTQLDIFEFLEYLTVIFNIKNTTKIIDAGNQPIYTNFINMIPIDFLMTNQISIGDYYPSYETSYNLDRNNPYIDSKGIKHYSYTKKTEIKKAPFLMIRVSRNIGRSKLSTKVIPKSSLKISENKSKLYLTSIIIHYGSNTGGHYTCLINPIDDLWYEYDDLSSKLKKIGTLDDIKENRQYTRNIVGLLYMPK